MLTHCVRQSKYAIYSPSFLRKIEFHRRSLKQKQSLRNKNKSIRRVNFVYCKGKKKRVLLKKSHGPIISRNICTNLAFLVVCNFHSLCVSIRRRLLIIGDVRRFSLCLHNAYKSGSGECPPPFALITSYEIGRERKKEKKKVSNFDNKI